MKGFRRFWVRSASLARAIIGCCEPMQADTVRRARLIRARAAEVSVRFGREGQVRFRFWLGLGRADAGCCGSVFVPSPRVARFLAACCFAACYLAPVVCDLDFVACRASLASHAARCVLSAGIQRVSSPLYFPDRLLLCILS